MLNQMETSEGLRFFVGKQAWCNFAAAACLSLGSVSGSAASEECVAPVLKSGQLS
jgi:hypothetical protein